ncbi:Glycosyltransferase family 61 protein [Rhynchospora pubera]|uniref:Glycosyltransferase family 61 protein n=1 Tax=Rhynchospora pubera TaxID=906938 RepID=A0AAV8AIK3_9POAL|nr:Glycosyltransferase family 61 protein [Rhynchospora pubera]KAJ4765408.1 Glycosyltransferase family 61 protein [Rhynchospora pubera]
MKKEKPNFLQIIRNFTQSQPFKLRFAFILMSVIVVLAFNATSEWNFLESLYYDSDAVMEGDEVRITSEYLEEISLSNKTDVSCDLRSARSDFCEIKDFVQIIGHSSILNYHSPCTNSFLQAHKSFKLKPHPRKHDKIALAHVKEISIEPVSFNQTPPHCTVMHIAPAIVFSTGGYTGNMFHDFTDVLIPLFITSFPFHGQVHFLVGEMQPRWIKKYRPLLKQLTQYEIINLNKVRRGLCYSHIIVGLQFHKEMSIEPKKTSNKYSMVDFAQIMRKSFGLERENITMLGIHNGNKPRLLIISRKKTRSFTNVKEVIKMATNLGYQVLVQEPNSRSKLREFARIVNSCDVLMGVHGAGLTNLVFLPANAVVIQIVPLGGLEKLSMEYFGIPALDMNLKYLQYNISIEESTLTEKYPKDHVVFKDPSSIRSKGWAALRSTYLVNQNVKLDVTRFSYTLLEALKHLHHYQ